MSDSQQNAQNIVRPEDFTIPEIIEDMTKCADAHLENAKRIRLFVSQLPGMLAAEEAKKGILIGQVGHTPRSSYGIILGALVSLQNTLKEPPPLEFLGAVIMLRRKIEELAR